MPADISADVAYIGGVWAEGVLYGIHIVVFFTLCYIFTSSAYTRGREKSSRILLAYSTVMFILSTAHVSLAVSELLQGFVSERESTPGGPPAFYRFNVFPKRKAIYIVNTLLGDSLLIWRVYVIYGRNWIVCAPCILILLGTIVCGLKTIVANAIAATSSVFDPSILSWITSTFVLTIVTQITATILIAARIYAASQPFQVSGEVPDNEGVGDIVGGKKGQVGRKYERTQREKYLGVVWLVVESGAVYSGAAIVQLVTYLEKMNAGVIMEFLLSQLSAMVPMIIVVRVGLGLAYQGASSVPYPNDDPSSSAPSSRRRNVVQLSAFQAASRNDDKSISLGTSSSGTKLGSSSGVLGLDSRVAGENLYMDGEKDKQIEEKSIRNRGLVGGDDDVV
ncbi:hypothetical protein BYT27DRAFT_6751895 [Phlegmacium glaucopus]|nr:hypothetical protein BYT27DRAFT_6751895 [Phlegmacium glaucopus]